MNMTDLTLQAPKHIISPRTAAYLVSVEVRTWSATKRDKKISDEVTLAKSASAEAGDFTKKLLAGNASHRAIVNYRQTVANWLQRLTYDWSGSWHMLPGLEMGRFLKEFAVHEENFNKLYDKFEAEYIETVSDMAFKLGDMFDRNDYPTVNQIRAKFGIRYLVMEVPENDFRQRLSSELAEDLHKHYESQVARIVDAAMGKAANRLLTLAERISRSCTEPEDIIEPDGTVKKGRKKKIIEGTFDQAREICAVLKEFNLTGNADLEEARARLESALSGVTTDNLRDLATTRKAVKDEMDEILGKFGALRVRNDDEDEEEE